MQGEWLATESYGIHLMGKWPKGPRKQQAAHCDSDSERAAGSIAPSRLAS